MASKKTDDVVLVVIPPLDLRRMLLKIEGTAPLVIGRFSETAKRTMADAQQKKVKAARAAKDPTKEYTDAQYFLEDGRPAASAVAFKASGVAASRYLPGSKLPMTMLRGLFRVIADGYSDDGYPLVAITGDGPVMWEAPVRNANKGCDLRYRARFNKWGACLQIEYNAALITPAQIANLFQTAGFHVGVGHWRPGSTVSNTGHLGTFRVVTEAAA